MTVDLTADVLAGMNRVQLYEVIQNYLGRDGDRMWAPDGPFCDVRVADAVERVLASQMTDVQQQIEIANLDVQDGSRSVRDVSEWKSKARRFNLLLRRRRTQVAEAAVAARIERARAVSRADRNVDRHALHRLTVAVYEHRDAVHAGTDDDGTDEKLWACLDTLMVQNGSLNEEVPIGEMVRDGKWTAEVTGE